MFDLPDPELASAHHSTSGDQGLPSSSTSLGLPGSGGTLLGELYGSTASAFGGASGRGDLALSLLECLCLALFVLFGFV